MLLPRNSDSRNVTLFVMISIPVLTLNPICELLFHFIIYLKEVEMFDFLWVPGRAGFTGNKLAASLAKTGATFPSSMFPTR